MKTTVLTISIILLSITDIWAYNFKVGDLCYNIIDKGTKTVEVACERESHENNYSYLSGVVTIPNTVTYNGTDYCVTRIGELAFYNCSAITQIIIPDNLTSINKSAFSGCSSLTEIIIPGSVKKIIEDAFSNCTSLTQINVESGNAVYSSEDGVWFNKDKTRLILYPAGKEESVYTIPNGVKCIGEEAFRSCSKLMKVTIPPSVTYIEEYAFFTSYSLTWFNVESGNRYYGSEDGVLFDYDKTTLIRYPIGKKEPSYTIPESVSWIGERSFIKCPTLMRLTIPKNVKYIAKDAFSYCSSLTQITILATEPPEITTFPFYNISPDMLVYVPAESLEAYQKDYVWKKFNLRGLP